MLIPTEDHIKTITDMRENALALLQSVQKRQEPIIVFHRNSPKAVLLSVKYFNQLMELLENYVDGEIARELEKKPKDKKDYIPFQKAIKELKIKV